MIVLYPLYIFWLLHQTTTNDAINAENRRCISFDSYIKPQLLAVAVDEENVIYLLTPTSNHNRYLRRSTMGQVVYLLTPTSNHNIADSMCKMVPLYIFWLLHQTTTEKSKTRMPSRCISFDSYIKPQLRWICRYYIRVVYLLTPTSNHNTKLRTTSTALLYIFWLLHQTTTSSRSRPKQDGCISFDSYIKPQHTRANNIVRNSCISFDSYIKPQQHSCSTQRCVSCISFDSYIKPQPRGETPVLEERCISFDSYIKPQLMNCTPYENLVVYFLTPTSNHN